MLAIMLVTKYVSWIIPNYFHLHLPWDGVTSTLG